MEVNTEFSVPFGEMAANFEKTFGVEFSEEQKSAIREALERHEWWKLQKLTGLAVSLGDHECPISAWGEHGMDYREAEGFLTRRVRDRVGNGLPLEEK